MPEAVTQQSPADVVAEEHVSMSDVFSLRKPKDTKAGFSSGAKNVLKGVAGGLVGIVAAPVVGAARGGVVGLGAGALAGVAGAVILPVTGVVTGVVQMGRGVAGEVESASARAAGKVWDQERREWIEPPTMALVPDAAAFDAPRAAWHEKQLDGEAGEKEIDYYAVLQVPRDASAAEIRKQYFVLARKYHPDKNPDDATAHARFQRIGQAYQVLSDEETRARYDAHGAEGLDVDFVDGGAFFNMLFGSERFEPLIGELVMAYAARQGGNITKAQLETFQNRRVHAISEQLISLLQPYVEGCHPEFEQMIRDKAEHWWVQASFGETILALLGKLFSLQSQIYSGGFFDSTKAKWSQTGNTLKSQVTAASAVIKVYQYQQKVEREMRQKEKAKSGAATKDGTAASSAGRAGSTDAELPPELEGMSEEMAAKALPLMLDAMWAANALDIEQTVRRACAAVLRDHSVPKAVQKSRAEGIGVMGAIFTDVAEEYKKKAAAEAAAAGVAAAGESAAEMAARNKILDAVMKMQEQKLAQDDGDHEL